jgi:hypothetical protein
VPIWVGPDVGRSVGADLNPRAKSATLRRWFFEEDVVIDAEACVLVASRL